MEDFNQSVRASIASGVAAEVGVPVSAVHVEVVPASVLLRITITTTDESQSQATASALSSTYSDATTASNLLGVTILLTPTIQTRVDIVVIAPSPSPSPPPYPNDSGSTNSVVIIAPIALGIAAILCLWLWSRSGRALATLLDQLRKSVVLSSISITDQQAPLEAAAAAREREVAQEKEAAAQEKEAALEAAREREAALEAAAREREEVLAAQIAELKKAEVSFSPGSPGSPGSPRSPGSSGAQLLIWACSPAQSPLPNVRLEANEVIQVYSAIFSSGSAKELHNTLRNMHPRQFLFAGHADAKLNKKRTLAFTDDSGKLSMIEPNALASMLKSVREGRASVLELVFLNGCKSDVLGRAVHEQACVPWVVCCRTVCNDEAACLFSKAFFRALGRPDVYYLDAFKEAKTAVEVETCPRRRRNGEEVQVQKFTFQDPDGHFSAPTRNLGDDTMIDETEGESHDAASPTATQAALTPIRAGLPLLLCDDNGDEVWVLEDGHLCTRGRKR